MPLTNEEKEKIAVMRKNEMGYRTIANAIGVTRDQVRDYCRTKSMRLVGKTGEHKEQGTCEACGSSYSKINKRHVYCSKECRPGKVYIKKKPREKDCLNCKKKMPCKSASHVYCSSQCRVEYNQVTKSCVFCERSFTTHTDNKYCSYKCRSNHIRKMTSTSKCCLECGKEFETSKAKPGKYCSQRCSKKHKRKKHHEYSKELLERHKGKIVALETYAGSDKLLTTMCINCGSVMKKKAHVYIGTGGGCNICHSNSYGEIEIENILIERELDYERQYYFEGLKLVNNLLFDFAIKSGGEVVGLIEYDGRQHFEPIEAWGGDVEFKRIQESDRLKNEYARANGIPLIRIKYDVKDIESELAGELRRD